MIDQRIKNEIKRLHWVFDWTGNWPLLDAAMQRDHGYARESKKICGIVLITKEISINENRTLTIYRASEDFNAQSEYLKNKFVKDPAFLKRSGRWYRFKVNRDLRALRNIKKVKNLQALSNAELTKLFQKARTHFAYNAMVDIYDWFIERVFTPMLQEYLEKRLKALGKADKTVDYLNTLITPHKISVIFRERTMLFDIVNYLKSSPGLVDAIKSGISVADLCSRNKRFRILFDNYFESYLWMPCLVNNPPHTRETVWNEIKQYVVTNEPLTIKTKRLGDNYDKRVIARSYDYLDELKPPKNIRLMIDGLRVMAFMRTEDYVVMSESTYCVIPLYTEIARRLGVTYHGLKEFLPEEIISRLQSGSGITSDEFKKRSSLNCYLTLGEQRLLFEGEDALAIKQVLEETQKTSVAEKNEFQGVVGNKGKVVGKARVALTYQSVSQVKPGEILVLASVSASFVPFLGKAAGIVAEFGGLTSHPVIVAREFNLPCVVGIASVTSAIKDGDLVQVDADKGTVRKLS